MTKKVLFITDPMKELKPGTRLVPYLTVGTGSQILKHANVGKMRLLSTPMKFSAISGFDLEVVEYVEYEG